MAGIYLHIPFCKTRCIYCDFYSTTRSELKTRYVHALCHELGMRKEYLKGEPIETIYFGGGTPSQLEEADFKRIFETIRENYGMEHCREITLEANPDDLSQEYLKMLSSLPFNRISMGIQTFDDTTLRLLKRRHNSQTAIEAVRRCREAGFQNINVDLMSGIPFQTLGGWEDTIKRVAELAPEHISAYSLIIEEGTPFYEKYGEGERAEARRRRELPDEDTERLMYQFTKNILQNYGYHRYEISNYAKEGYECRHNLGYWNRTEYLGIGTGAASLINNQRFVEGGEIEVLTPQNQMEEYMFLGLRRIKGISKADFRRTFGRSVENVYGKVLIHMYQKQLLEDTGDNIRLTEKGIDVSNYVMSEFLF